MDLSAEIKDALISTLMLDVSADEIGDETPLFGPGGLGLDSVDALQLTVEIEKRFGLKISDPQVARTVLQSVHTIAEAVRQHRGA